jgi:hypothetical protein
MDEGVASTKAAAQSAAEVAYALRMRRAGLLRKDVSYYWQVAEAP